ncbi:hypothetical protein [Kitasatospora sp. CB01950]|uniref:hypothetical protein n=1 Tax=Kitasatospora sp. CB01950 TaxID=1703930 RepID=UPI00093A5914|nr:hypothetical protein [Kitasatospora sp. CB01950]OKJ16089.1 hypothetical protein AMK19_07965 [Kitasatospora sp. CB01950]
MNAATALAVLGAVGLPLAGYAGARRRVPLFVVCAVLVAVGLLLRPAGIGPTGFGFACATGLVTSFWRTDAVLDAGLRANLGLPPLMRGDPATRGLFDIVWLVRYRRAMRANPVPTAPRHSGQTGRTEQTGRTGPGRG